MFNFCISSIKFKTYDFILVAKLTALEEFKSQKEELLAKLESLEKHIEFLEGDHKNKVNEIEKKVIIDKDRYALTKYYLIKAIYSIFPLIKGSKKK